MIITETNFKKKQRTDRRVAMTDYALYVYNAEILFQECP